MAFKRTFSGVFLKSLTTAIVVLILVETYFQKEYLAKKVRYFTSHCPVLSSPTDGSIVSKSTSRGGIYQFACNKGFKPIGSTTITCMDVSKKMVWSSRPPICEKIKCVVFDNLPGGSVHVEGLEPGKKSKFECDQDHEINGPAETTCIMHATLKDLAVWDKNNPTCDRKQCPAFTLSANVKTDQKTRNTKDVIKLTCDDGFTLKGNAEVLCKEDKTWDKEFPSCEEIMCPEYQLTEHLHAQPESRKLKEVIKFTCDEGWIIKGNPEVLCKEDGKWSQEFPLCIVPEKSCTSITSLENGAAKQTNKDMNFTCNEGFKIEGNSVITCGPDGNWSANIPKCVKKL